MHKEPILYVTENRFAKINKAHCGSFRTTKEEEISNLYLDFQRLHSHCGESKATRKIQYPFLLCEIRYSRSNLLLLWIKIPIKKQKLIPKARFIFRPQENVVKLNPKPNQPIYLTKSFGFTKFS